MDNVSIQLSRYILGLSWIYHGLFPKIITVAPTEKALTATFGFSEDISYLITKFAGVGEILFGILILVMYKNKHVITLNIAALVGLCFFVAVSIPVLLIEAFNPVTTNVALIGFSIILLRHKHM